MKKKGFTLIELLAVIVILAIIAVIAVPIVLNIVKDAQEKANKRSAELYIKGVELAIARQNLEEEFANATCEVQTNGYLLCTGIPDPIKVDVEHSATGGTIILEKGRIISTLGLEINNLAYNYTNGNLKLIDDTMTYEEILSVLENEAINYLTSRGLNNGKVEISNLDSRVDKNELKKYELSNKIILVSYNNSNYSFSLEYLLPSTYKEIEYIESTREQYLNTGYYTKTNTKVEMDLSFSGTYDNSGVTAFISSANSSNGPTFQANFGNMSHHSTTIFFWLQKTFAAGAEKKEKNYSTNLLFNRNTMILNRQTGVVTYGDTIFQAEAAVEDTNSELKIFCNRSNEPFQAYNMRLYSLIITEGSETKMNLIPCLDNNNKPGMFDTISGVTLYNQRAGADFTPGPEV